nr:MAG TPA: hypothetical protein [Caudoviricetes sp.]
MSYSCLLQNFGTQYQRFLEPPRGFLYYWFSNIF